VIIVKGSSTKGLLLLDGDTPDRPSAAAAAKSAAAFGSAVVDLYLRILADADYQPTSGLNSN